MKSKTLLETISELKVNFFKYLETKVQYYGLVAFEKAVNVIKVFVSNAIILLVFACSLLFLSGAAALYLGELMDSYIYGLLIVGGFYFLLGIVFCLFSDRIFGRAIIKTLLKVFFEKEDE